MFEKSSKKFNKLNVKSTNGHSEQSEESQRLKVDSSGQKSLRMTNLFNQKSPYALKKAFTLAEVLITLVIIGVVAAITVPMLNNSANDKQWNVARQKAQATIGEAFRLATVNGEISASDNDTNTAEKFVKNVLPKYLKIAKSCDSATDCGFSSKVKRPDGTEMNWPTNYSDTTFAQVTVTQPTTAGSWGTITDYTGPDEPYYFQTLDGFSVKLFYNPSCAVNYKDKFRVFNNNDNFVQQSIDVACFNATYDMNGAKGPNQVGKDIGFVGSFYNGYEAKAAAVLPYKEDKKMSDLNDEGKVPNGDYWLGASTYCNTLHESDWILPDVNELSLIYLNNMLVHGEKFTGRWFWTRSPLEGSSTTLWNVNFDAGSRGWPTRTYTNTTSYVRCVRSNALK